MNQLFPGDTYKLYFDRTKGTIYGFLTLQKIVGGKAIKIFNRLPCASGQSGYTNGGDQDWIRGKGPTPFGKHWVSTKSEPLQMSPVGTRFYVISTIQGDRSIEGGSGRQRLDRGLHLDNAFPGSAGCIALRNSTKESNKLSNELFDFLDVLYVQGIHYIELEVL